MEKFKVLIPLDDADFADTIVKTACSMINKENSEITLLNIEETTLAEEEYFIKEPEKFIKHESKKADFAFVESYLENNGFNYKGFIYKKGKASDVILNMSYKHDFNLIVMGSHNKGNIERLMLGSVSYKVSRASKCSILLVKPLHHPKTRLNSEFKALLGIDTSEHSEYVSNNLSKFIDKKRAKISIINVYPYLQDLLPSESFVYTEIERIIEESELAAKDLIKNISINVLRQGFTIENKYVIQGSPAKEIINKAEKENFDLIIVGSHGLSGVAEWLMGSVSSKIAERSIVPVLIIK